jgi:hypothetical protein
VRAWCRRVRGHHAESLSQIRGDAIAHSHAPEAPAVGEYVICMYEYVICHMSYVICRRGCSRFCMVIWSYVWSDFVMSICVCNLLMVLFWNVLITIKIVIKTIKIVINMGDSTYCTRWETRYRNRYRYQVKTHRHIRHITCMSYTDTWFSAGRV